MSLPLKINNLSLRVYLVGRNFLIGGIFDENSRCFFKLDRKSCFAREPVVLFNIVMIKALWQPGIIQETKPCRSIVFSPNKRFRSLVSYLRSKDEEILPAIWWRIQSDLGQFSLNSEIQYRKDYL